MTPKDAYEREGSRGRRDAEGSDEVPAAETVDALKIWAAVAAVPTPRAATPKPTISWPDDA